MGRGHFVFLQVSEMVNVRTPFSHFYAICLHNGSSHCLNFLVSVAVVAGGSAAFGAVTIARLDATQQGGQICGLLQAQTAGHLSDSGVNHVWLRAQSSDQTMGSDDAE